MAFNIARKPWESKFKLLVRRFKANSYGAKKLVATRSYGDIPPSDSGSGSGSGVRRTFPASGVRSKAASGERE
jgi:hypothetical protein